MKFVSIILALSVVLSFSPIAYSSTNDDDSGQSAVGSTVMGGLLGAGLGAAIGSASGNAGKGAAIGGGVGALGGLLMGAQKEKNRRAQEEAEYAESGYEDEAPQPVAPKDMPVKKKIVRTFDENGNIVSEEEVAR